MSTTEVAVIGAGPAGSSAAITAARLGIRVTLLEAGSFPRQKVCGEFLSPEALDVAADLLRELPSADTVFRSAPVLDRMRLLLGGRTIEASIRPPALSVARYDLDALLWEAAVHAGVRAESNCEVRSIDGSGPFTLRTSHGVVTAAAVIVAAGRWSRFAADRSVPRGPKWIGVKAHYRESRPARSTDLYFFSNGYCGVQPVYDDVINACAMVRSDVATSLDQVFARHPLLADRAAAWQPLMQPVSTAPLVYRRPQPVQGNLVFAGDAAGFIDPFVGDGISIALRSGREAALCLHPFCSGASTLSAAAAEFSHQYTRQFAPLLVAASQVRRLVRLPPLARAAAFELMRLPGILPFVIRKTRNAA